MIRTIGAAIGVLIVVFFMSDVASRLASASSPASQQTTPAAANR